MLKAPVQIQSEFPMLSQKMHNHKLIYLDNAATTFKPQFVIDRIAKFYSSEYATVHRAIYQISERSDLLYHQARLAVQQFVNAKSFEEIIFSSGTTASINLIAQSFSQAFLQKGDEILVSEIEHHSNLVPWQLAAQKSGATLRFIPVLDSGDIDLKALQSMLSEKTKIVSLAHISNVTGGVHPIKELIRCIRISTSAKILVDGAQAIAHMPVDVQSLDVDFYVFSAHKMYGPTGVGVLYGKKELLEQLPPVFGGGDMIQEVTLSHSTYNNLPYKFEAGTPNIAGVIGLHAAIEYIQSVGLGNIAEIERDLTNKLLDELTQIEQVRLIGSPKERSALISFEVENIHSLDLATLLNLKGVAVRSGHLCAQTALKRFNMSSMLRASLSFYNEAGEIEIFVQHLKGLINQLLG